MDCKTLYERYWDRHERRNWRSFSDAEVLADQVLSVCGGGSVLDVGCGRGALVRALLRRGVDAHGIDLAAGPIEQLNALAPGRVHVGDVLQLPFPDDTFDTLICTNLLERLDESDVPGAIRELYRVARRGLFLNISTTTDAEHGLHRCIHGRDWWETQFLQAGFRKHPRGQTVASYESLEHSGSPVVVMLEKIPPDVLARYPLEALRAERDLHMDMLRESGRRADAHEARYHLGCPFVRPGDVVLDAACGLGYGSAILLSNTPVGRIIAIDSSQYAIDYARANYGCEAIEFHQRDAADLSFLPDHSIDYLVSMETLEHLPDPESFLEEIRRVLRPGGRIMVSVPNEWVDETGRDPNPHHLHVYTWARLRTQLERHFILERGYAQTCGGSIKLTDRPRRLREVPLDEPAATEAEWWLALAMKDPVGFDRQGYHETSFPDHTSNSNYNITAFGRDYENPWLVKGMVAIGMRVVNPAALERMARKVLECSRPGSADAGAALCILAYRMFEDESLSAAKVQKFLARIDAYQEFADDTPHAWRWRISTLYIAGSLELAIGHQDQARRRFLECAKLDCLKFSPLLATKTVDALFRAGLISACNGQMQQAAADWQGALREAHRVLAGSWLNIWGKPDKVVEFGLPEATQVLDLATRCAYGLVGLRYWPVRPGYAWGQAFRNTARELARLQRLSADQFSALNWLEGVSNTQRDQLAQFQQAIADFEQSIARLHESNAAQAQELDARGRALAESARQAARLEESLADSARQLQERDGTIESLSAELAELRRLSNDLTQQSEMLRQRGASLSDQLAAASQQRAERELEVTNLRTSLTELRARFDELHAWTETLDQAHAERCGQVERLRRRIEGIESGTGWAVLQAGYRVRRMIFPRDSRRERAGRWCMHKFRGLRDRWQYGPRCVAAWIGRGLARRWRSLRGAMLPEPPQALAEPVRFAGQQPGLVSVILPVYNQASLLGESIESVLSQTYPHLELIVLNDGSRDGVEQVLDAYVGHPKVRILTQANQKLPKALSNAFDFARGEFWTWTSADNLMEARQLETQVAFLRTQPDAAMVYCDYLAIDDRGEPLRDPNFRPHNRAAPDSPKIRVPRDTRTLNTVQDNFIGACFMYRGWVGRLLGDYLPSMGVEDYDYWMRINGLFPIRHLGTDDLLYRYRVHDNALNAQAQQHHIYDRVNQLMEYEKDRRWYFDEPWVVLVDEATQAWSGSAAGPHTIRRLDAPGALSAIGHKLLVLVRADSLPQLADKPLPPQTCVAAWFSEDPRAPYRYATEIQTVAHVCCAQDEAVLARLALFTPHAFGISPGSGLLRLVMAFANNRLFAEKTIPADDWSRVLPRAHVPAGRRTRVLFQVQNFTQGGLEQVVLDITAVLDPERFEVFLLILGDEGPAAEKARQRGLQILRIESASSELAYRELLKEKKIDVVNAHYSVFGCQIARELNIPFLQTIHNSYVWFGEEERAQYKAADPFTTLYICVSNMVAAYADVQLQLPPEKMVVVTNGIDVRAMDAARGKIHRDADRTALGYGPEDFVFLCTASITEVKAQHLLIEGLGKAIRRNPRIRIAFLGRPLDPVYGESYARKLHEAIESADLGHAVQFLGYHPDPQKFYYLADGFALPSFVEGWSLALAEALYAGLPVIASDVGSSRELLGRTGGHVLGLPCGSLLDVDGPRFYRLIHDPHPDYAGAIADALLAVAADPEPPAVSEALRRSFDRAEAFLPYARIFEWAASGGDPKTAQVWRPALLQDAANTRVSLQTRRRPTVRAASSGDPFKPADAGVADVCARVRESEGAIIFLRSIAWSNWLFQRPHHLARCLADRGYTVIYDDGGRFTGFAGFREIEPNLFLFRGSADLLHRLPAPILWSFCYNYHLRDEFAAACPVVYDLIDDFAVHPHDQGLIARNHERAMGEAAVVAYVARHLEDLVRQRPDRLYLPNGVEAEFFADAEIAMPPDRRMRRIIAEGKPIAGYYGALASWFDYDLVEQTARLRPDWNFVLIGIDYDGSLQNRSLLACPNVHWLGPRDYSVLPAYLRAFDVATIPFVINDITKATSPLKLYEYFAGGKPVITSPMPECMAFPEVRVVRSAAEYAQALPAALAQGRDPAFRERLREIAHQNSWQQRIEAVLESLAMPRTAGAVA